MKTFKAIQYIERFKTESEAQACCLSLNKLDGCLMARASKKDEFPDNGKNWVAQAIFECEEDVNPEAFHSYYGWRVVTVPLSFIKNENKN